MIGPTGNLVDDDGVELIFPEFISLNASGGPSFNTTVTVNASGVEQRTPNWLRDRLKWDVAHAAKLPAAYKPLVAFFRLANGKTYAFRFKDWTDYQATFAEGVLGLGVGTGAPTLPLGKIYEFAGVTTVRTIFKPRPGTLAVKMDGTLLTEGSSAGNWEVDLSQGLVTFTTTVTKSITAISKASSGVVTSASHGVTNGQWVWISGVVGMVEINNMLALVSSATTDTFATGINTTAFTTYASGGTVKFYPQPGNLLTASFNFDVQARFDTDEMTGSIDTKNNSKGLIMSWNDIPIIETRVR